MMLSRAETKALYDKIAKVYDLLSEHTEGPVCEEGLRMLAPQPGETVLEIGYGTGHALVWLARAVGPSGKVHGIDLSDGMMAVTESLIRHEGVADRAELRSGDATDLPYPADSMDAVFMSFTLELFDTPEIPVVLAQCRRVLRAGGRIVVVGMSKEGEHGMVYEAYEWTHRHFPNFVDCRPIFVSRVVAEAGFRVTRKRNVQIWVPMEIVRGEKPVSARAAGDP
ncbi:MAG: methyltransferase domain-containing protein [Bryobacteraceae bacterium]|jgi:demethylmenaquinone methyltransferase/2-methoxy-6-polyprenyl-1,4-benzoquinol methylase